MMRERLQPGACRQNAAGRRRFPRPRAVAAGALAVLLAGCASMAPPVPVPSAPVAATYPDDALPGVDADAPIAASVAWRDYFTDPQLRALIEQALRHNRDLRLATLRVAEARAGYRIRRADQWPGVGLEAQGARSRVPGDLSPTGRPLVSGDYEAGLGLSWELDLWGRVRSLKAAALETYFATEAARQAATVNLIAAVADGYVGLRALDERLRLAQQTIATRQETYRIFKRRVEVGATSKLELTQVQTLLNQAQALRTELERERATQAHALALLVGAPVDLDALAPLPADVDAWLPALRPGLPSDLLLDRPDILAAEYQLRAANADIGAARAAFFPRVALTGALGSASAQLDGLFDSGSRAWSFVPTISLPIFSAGRLRANLDLATVRREAAVAEYERAIQAAFRDVSDALSARRWLAEQVRILQDTVDAQTERARLAGLRYDNGAAAFLEVLDAQRDLLTAQQQLAQARGALLSSHILLYAALGGGPLPAGDADAP
jgi:multidrug efflux system outer membrane protein